MQAIFLLAFSCAADYWSKGDCLKSAGATAELNSSSRSSPPQTGKTVNQSFNQSLSLHLSTQIYLCLSLYVYLSACVSIICISKSKKESRREVSIVTHCFSLALWSSPHTSSIHSIARAFHLSSLSFSTRGNLNRKSVSLLLSTPSIPDELK